MSELLFALWFFLPAGLANGVPVVVSRLPLLRRWNKPMDFGKTYKGKRIFGSHKTWRGIISGPIVGGLTGALIYSVHPQSINRVNIIGVAPLASMVMLGAVMGFGALYGDAVESFFKRQIGIDEGKSWFPFDQLDYIIGGLVASLPLIILSAKDYSLIVIVWFIIHLLVSYIGYLLHLKSDPI